MLIPFGNSQLSIFWRHSLIDEKTGKPLKKNKSTKCIIRLGIGEQSQTLMEADAKCYRKDVFSKCHGRKLSLKRAIEYINSDPASIVVLDRETRTLIWKTYAETTKCNFTVGVKKPRIPKEELTTEEHVYSC